MKSAKRICKLLARLLNNPKDVSFENLDRVLRACGYEVRQPRGRAAIMYMGQLRNRYLSLTENLTTASAYCVNSVYGVCCVER